MFLQVTIEVRANQGTSKSNRLSAHSLSLEELLRYTDDDTKETAFEVRILPKHAAADTSTCVSLEGHGKTGPDSTAC